MPQQNQPNAPRPQAHPPSGSAASPAGEEILYQGLMRHVASLGGYLEWGLASIAGGFAAWGLAQIEAVANLGLPLWILGLVGIPGLAWTFLRHITTRFKLSSRRVEYERGVFAKEVDSLELWRVLDVRYRQTFVDRILGNATIILIGTDKTDPELALYGLPDHRALFEKLRDAVQAARHTSRPMEVVGQDGAFEDLGMGR
jgi:hypothetical protein